MDALKKIRIELVFYRIVFIILLISLAGAFAYQTRNSFKKKTISSDSQVLAKSLMRQSLPFYEKIMAVITPLEYSGFPDMVRPEIKLSIDFHTRFWTLHNLHRFDANNQILLNEGRYGLCGELAAHVYQKIKSFLPNQYGVLFLRAAQSGFFLRPYSSHIILVVHDRRTGERYFLDPSFHRYGKEKDFEDYLFFEPVDVLSVLNGSTRDVDFPVDFGTPLLIRDNFLLYFMVESVDGKFDKNNFALAITANKRYKYSGRYVFALRKQNGEKQSLKNEWLLNRLLTPEEIRQLLGKINEWFDQQNN